MLQRSAPANDSPRNDHHTSSADCPPFPNLSSLCSLQPTEPAQNPQNLFPPFPHCLNSAGCSSLVKEEEPLGAAPGQPPAQPSNVLIPSRRHTYDFIVSSARRPLLEYAAAVCQLRCGRILHIAIAPDPARQPRFGQRQPRAKEPTILLRRDRHQTPCFWHRYQTLVRAVSAKSPTNLVPWRQSSAHLVAPPAGKNRC